MSEAKATKRPWRVFNKNKSGILSIMEGKSNKEIIHWAGFDSSPFPKQNEANAALIVEAVNAHDSLLARNKRLTEALKILATALDDDGSGEYWTARKYLDKREIYNGDLNDLRVLHAVAKAAIAGDEEQTHNEN